MSLPARLEQLAEECTECAQAALKLARYERGENPVCKTEYELEQNLIEELTDVQVALEVLPYRPSETIAQVKRWRWEERLNAKELET